ncbi:TPA: hypothetical protein ACFRG8_001391 [Neisseria lactamica]
MERKWYKEKTKKLFNRFSHYSTGIYFLSYYVIPAIQYPNLYSAWRCCPIAWLAAPPVCVLQVLSINPLVLSSGRAGACKVQAFLARLYASNFADSLLLRKFPPAAAAGQVVFPNVSPPCRFRIKSRCNPTRPVSAAPEGGVSNIKEL